MSDNKIDESIYNEKSLYLLNIKELRTLGRKLGVPAPAAKKKKELVEYILNIVYGKVSIPARNLYGRPSTHEFDMEKYLDKIKKNSDVSNKLKTISFSEDYGLKKVSEPSVEYKINDNIETRIFIEENGKCYLRVRGFIESENDIVVLNSIKERFKLENYDVVEIIFIGDYYKIYSINGIKVGDKIRQIIVDGKQLMAGRIQDFYLSTKEKLKDSIEKLSIECESKNVKLVILSQNNYDRESVVSICYNSNEDKSKVYKSLMRFIVEAEKAVYDGEDLVIAIEDYDLLDGIISTFEMDISDRIKKYLYDVISNIVELGNIFVRFKIEENYTY